MSASIAPDRESDHCSNLFYSLFILGERLHGKQGSREDDSSRDALVRIIRSHDEERSQSPHQCHCSISSIKSVHTDTRAFCSRTSSTATGTETVLECILQTICPRSPSDWFWRIYRDKSWFYYQSDEFQVRITRHIAARRSRTLSRS